MTRTPSFSPRLMIHVVVLVAILVSRPASGQVTSDFGQVQTRLQRGYLVLVIDDSGRSIRGSVLDVSTSSLLIALKNGQREFDGIHVQRIDRLERDSVRNGALWGLVVGAAAGFLGMAAAARSGASLDSAGVIVGLGLIGAPAAGAAIGAAVDAAVMVHQPIFDRSPAASTGGVRLPRETGPAPILAAVHVRF